LTDVVGKVIKILDSYRVVINLGKDKVQKGQKFIIYDEGEEITDPDTKTSLGKIEILKAKVEIEHVQDKFSIAVSEGRTVTKRVSMPSWQYLWASSMLPSTSEIMSEEVRDPLPLGSGDLPQIDRTIRVGDRVRAI
jgi:hypothetical protein